MKLLFGLLGGLRGRFALAAAAGTGTVAAGMGLLATAAYLIVRADLRPPILELTVAIVGVRFFGIARAALRYLERLAGHDAALRLVTRLRVGAFSAIERLAPAGTEDLPSGAMLTRTTDDLGEIERGMVRAVIPTAVTAMIVISGGIVAWMLAPPLGPPLAAGLAITSITAGAVSVGAARRSTRSGLAVRSDLATATIDTIEGRSEALVYGRAGDLMAKVADADRRLVVLQRRAAWSSGLGGALVALGSGLTLWLVVRTGVDAASAGTLDPILLGALAMYAIAAFEPVALLPPGVARLDGTTEAARRLHDLERAPDPVAVPAAPVPVPSPVLALRGAGLHRRGSWHLRDVDLTIAPGRRVAVVGASGAGKSTLIDVLMRFREIDEGSYLVEDRPASDIEPDALRLLIGLAAEDAPLLDGTLAENLAVGNPDAVPALRDAAIRVTGLAPLVERLPAGLETRVGPQGSFVSGGERRRVVLARAFLSERPILILDEPTAGLEPDLARTVLNGLFTAAATRGILMITHDPAGLDQMDEIVVLAEGRVVERGSPDELLTSGGAFATLRRTMGV